jgi:hypothetical protein
MRTHVIVFAVVAASLFLETSPVSAQIQGVRPEGHLNLDRGIDVGLGGRVDIPLIPEGFIASVNDEFAISPGVDFLVGDNHSWFAVPVAMQWNFYFENKWSVFPDLGIALLFGGGRGRRNVDLDLVLAFGGRYHFSDRNAVLVRLGWPILFQLGMTF